MRVPKIPSQDLLIRFAVIAIAAISPFILIFSNGVLPSISSYWNTDLQPLFILTNFFTAFYFLNLKNWRISGALLLLLTAFSVEVYGSLHNVAAIIFFIFNLYPLFFSNQFRWVTYLYLLAIPVFIIFGMLWGEIVAVEFLCLHQWLRLHKLYRLSNLHKN